MKSDLSAAASFILLVLSDILKNAECGILSKSIFNGKGPQLAIDGNPATCYVSGFGSAEWIKVDLGQAQTVTGITITGILSPFNVRVGDTSSDLGDQGGFHDNAWCFYSNGMTEPSSTQTFNCRRQLSGRFVSIETVDPMNLIQMVICEIQINFA